MKPQLSTPLAQHANHWLSVFCTLIRGGRRLTCDIDKALADTAAHGEPRNMLVLLDWIPSCGLDFHCTTGLALGPTQPPIKWVPGLSRGLTGQGVGLNTHPHIVPRLSKEWRYTSTPLLSLHGPIEGRL
jgi:hypothetical protein